MNDPAPAFAFIIDTVPGLGWDGEWRPDPESVARIDRLEAGTPIAIVKRAPDGSEATKYLAVIRRTDAPSPWIEVEATWTHGPVTVGGLVFESGDTLREFFSATHPFNAFALFSPSGAFKGWYGNVTFPTFLIGDETTPTLVWHDLYLDVVILPDRAMHLLDDDELADSGLPSSEPSLYEAIIQARHDLIDAIPGFLLT